MNYWVKSQFAIQGNSKEMPLVIFSNKIAAFWALSVCFGNHFQCAAIYYK